MTLASRRSSGRRAGTASAPGLRHLVAMAALCAVSGLAWSGPSATVLFSSGEVRAVSAKGEVRELKTGAQVESGETVQTGKGRVQLRMVDGAMMALSEQTTLRLDDYRVATAPDGEERGFMSLVRGALRTISGSIGHPRAEEYRLDTPSGTIGIRGTEYTAAVGGDGALEVGVIGGRVAVCNDGGCVDVPKGFSALTPSRAVKPAVSVKPLVLLQPANAGTVAVAPAEAATHAAEGAPARSRPTSGEQVSQFLVAALTPPTAGTPATGGNAPADEDALPTLPGSTSVGAAPGGGTGGQNAPIVVVTAPAPAPSPAASPAPSPSPAPGPSGPPAAPAPPTSPAPPAPPTPPTPPVPPGPGESPPGPGPTPLRDGKVTLGLVWSTDKGDVASGLTEGTARFNPQGGLREADNAATGKSMLERGKPVDAGADGVIGWGRWTDGESQVKGTSNGKGVGTGHVATLHYFAIAATPTGPVNGQFSSMASTAPTVQSDGKLVATGAVNGASGSFNASLQLQLGGKASYSLTVPVAGQTFSLVGVATQTSASGFSGVSLISSTGTGCQGGCTGSLGNNVSVIGQIAGVEGTRAGVAYGFDSRIGNVSGVIVFKR